MKALHFKEASDVIVVYEAEEASQDVKEIVYTEDLFSME